MESCSQKLSALNERATAVLEIERNEDGSLRILVRPVNGWSVPPERKRKTLTFVAWRENGDLVRFRFNDVETGMFAYAQGGAPLIELLFDLGLTQL